MNTFNSIISAWEQDTVGVGYIDNIEERCKYLSGVNNLNYCEDICSLINTNKSLVSELVGSLYKHSAGFYRLNFFKNNTSSAKLHFFTGDSDVIDTNIHLHGFSAYSNVLTGEIKNTTFGVDNLSDEELFIFNPLYEEFISKFDMKKDIILKDLFEKFGVINIQAFIYFFELVNNKPYLLNDITENLYEILLKESNNISYETNILLISLGISDIEKLSSYFIQFQVGEDYNLEKIAQKKIKYIGTQIVSQGDSYELLGNDAHKLSANKNTRTLFVTDNNPKSDDNIIYNGGHFKTIPELVDPFENEVVGLGIDKSKDIILYNINEILKSFKF